MNRLPRKRRTREHIISDLSENHTERQALLCGYTVQPNRHDYGIDLEITTFNKRGEIDEGKILVQLKASERLKPTRAGAISCRLDKRDVLHWLAQPMPVILIVFDAGAEIAFWLYIQSYFRKHPVLNVFVGKTITVPIPLVNVVNPSAMMKFGRFRDRVLNQMGEVVHDEDENEGQDDPVR